MLVRSLVGVLLVLGGCSVTATSTDDGQAGAAADTARQSTTAKTCFPDHTVTWAGCETGCCHEALWEIADACVAPSASASWQPSAGCEAKVPAPATLCPTVQIRGESALSFVISDSKMLSCPDRLVHMLTIPKTRVCGDDDPDRFTAAADGFTVAWNAAVTLISDPSEIALVVNSRLQRSQNQLHIHSVRLKPGARAEIMALPVAPKHIDDLGEAWAKLREHDAEAGFGDLYGGVVIADPAGGWLVATVDGTANPDPVTKEDRNAPEQRFTCWRCDTCPVSPP